MSSFQIGFLIFAGLAIVAIILGAIFIKSKKVERSPDIRLDLPDSAIGFPEPVVDADADEVAQPDTVLDITIAVDRTKLRQWYSKAAQKHRKKLGKIGWWIRFYLIFQGIALVVASMALVSMNAFDEDTGGGGMLFLVLLGVGFYVWVLWYYLTNSTRSVTDAISSNKYVMLGERQFPAIWAVCADLMNKMELNKYELKIYYVKTTAVEASVLVDENVIYLLLSRGLITYYRTNPKDVESILGHEFGHVYQGDTKMLLVNRNTVRIPAILQMISMGIAAITIVGALWSGSEEMTPQAGTSFILVSYFVQLSSLRKGAEYLADVASIAFVNDSSLPKLINKYMPARETSNYPSSKNRITFLGSIDKIVAANRMIQF